MGDAQFVWDQALQLALFDTAGRRVAGGSLVIGVLSIPARAEC
jgi:hypothetical protein